MSGILPANTTLQLSNNAGDITHQGVLGSNASGTTLLTSTFPTTSTGTSLGHYHYTESTTNALKFLNASGTGGGGHQFWHSSSTEAPIKVLETNKIETKINTQFVVDKSTPSTIQTATLGNGLQVVNDTSSSAVFADSFVIQDTPNNRQCLTYAFQTVYQDNSEGVSTTILAPLASNYNQVFIASGNTSSVIIQVDTPSITSTNNTDVSVLTATDLTFGGVSLPTRVTTAETDIDILTIKQTNVLQVYASPAIYADGQPMLPVPSASSNTYGQFGWYFINSTVGWKINWYMPPATGMIVSDILGLYLRFFNCATTSNDNTPFLTVYTTPTGSGDYFPGFFKSSMTYIFDQSVNPVANTNYTMFENVTGTCPNPSSYASNLVGMEQSPVNNPRGDYAPTESILAIVIGTSSSSPVNSVEFIAQKLGVMTATGTQELLYQSLL